MKLGFSHFGATTLRRPFSFDIYRSWLNEGLHGDMEYLEAHAPFKENPQSKWPLAKSALVFAAPYFPHPERLEEFPLKNLRVSLYAQGYDYHFWFKQQLENLCQHFRSLFPEDEFVAMTDSSPVLERDLAHQAGLGWIGKNTCLIHPKNGSLFFIGEIYSSLTLDFEAELVHDFCGTCTRCIDICPTQALISPRKLDARKCISYLTIESKEIPSSELREKIGDWFFGCDLCQTICPWNEKAFKGKLIKNEAPCENKKLLEEELRWILVTSGKQLEKALKGTPLSRAGNFGLKRNALIVAHNQSLRGLKSEIEDLFEHPKLGELAKWAHLGLQE
jgi:epoxyqueuosine reductase